LILEVLSLGVGLAEHEADHSLPCEIEVKNAWGCVSAPQYIFMVYCLIKTGMYICGVFAQGKNCEVSRESCC
jgi:hypothetical protein